MDKKKVGIIAIILSAVIHVCLLLFQFTKVAAILKNPNDFSLFPLIWVIVLLLLLLGHVGLYVLIMDYKERKQIVWAEDNWWEKWDEA